MTTSPVVSLTDEMVAELERKASRKADEGFILVHNLECAAILALLAERAELKRDAARYRFIRDADRSPIYCREIEYYNGHPCGAHNVKDGQLDAAIDAAMETEK